LQSDNLEVLAVMKTLNLLSKNAVFVVLLNGTFALHA